MFFQSYFKVSHQSLRQTDASLQPPWAIRSEVLWTYQTVERFISMVLVYHWFAFKPNSEIILAHAWYVRFNGCQGASTIHHIARAQPVSHPKYFPPKFFHFFHHALVRENGSFLIIQSQYDHLRFLTTLTHTPLTSQWYHQERTWARGLVTLWERTQPTLAKLLYSLYVASLTIPQGPLSHTSLVGFAILNPDMSPEVE